MWVGSKVTHYVGHAHLRTSIIKIACVHDRWLTMQSQPEATQGLMQCLRWCTEKGEAGKGYDIQPFKR